MSAPDSEKDKEHASVAAEADPSGNVQAEAAGGEAVAQSDPDADPRARQVAFAESDYRETKMTYDHGKLPLYVAAVWAVTLVGLIAYYVSYGLPDLQTWGMP